MLRRLILSWRFWSLCLLALGLSLRLYREIRTITHMDVTSWRRAQSADCAVVLTGGPGRVREGFDLLAEGRIKKLIISGVHPEVRLKDLLPMWPFYPEVSEQDVVLERRAETTWGNAQQSLPIVEALRCRDVLLVTSRTHMYRAQKTFQAVFPGTISIYPQTVVGASWAPSLIEASVEAVKSLFYSIWAY